MTFKVLCNSIKTLSETQVFQVASSELEKIIFSIRKEQLIKLVKEIGIIPEAISHDSKEKILSIKKFSNLLLE